MPLDPNIILRAGEGLERGTETLMRLYQLGEIRKANDLKAQLMQSKIDKEKSLKDIADKSTKNKYDKLASISDDIVSETELDPDLYQENLVSAGYLDEAKKVSDAISKMEKSDRDEMKYKMEQAAKLATIYDTPEEWPKFQEAMADMGLDLDGVPDPFEDRERIIALGTNVSDLLGSSTSEFERLESKRQKGDITETEQSRLDILSGQKARPSTAPYQNVDVEGKATVFDKTTGSYTLPEDAKLTGAQLRANQSLEDKQIARVEKQTTSMRKEASEGVKHFNMQRISVNDAIAALESGDTGLADTLLTQVMSQVQDTNVRAFQMYAEFDRSYGDITERIFNSVSRFLSGSRTPEERQVIKDTLLEFKRYSDPAASRVRNKYRSLAKEHELDPFKVVPPDSPEDIRDAPGVEVEEKLRLLKRYYPEQFSGL